jgi:hypothetical protein
MGLPFRARGFWAPGPSAEESPRNRLREAGEPFKMRRGRAGS